MGWRCRTALPPSGSGTPKIRSFASGPAEIVDAGLNGWRRPPPSGSTRRCGRWKTIGAVAPGDSQATFSEAMHTVEIGLQAEQKPERLDAAGNVDRFAVAIGEIDLLVHDSADACAKRSKAARAELDGLSSSASSSA